MGECSYCGLKFHEALKHSDNLCLPCSRLFKVAKTERELGKFTLPALITGLLIYFVDMFSDFQILLIPLALFIIVPGFVTNALLLRIQYYGIPEIERLTHQMRMKDKINDGRYLDSVTEYLTNHKIYNDYLEELLLKEYVDQVLLSQKPNPPRTLSDWAGYFGFEVTKFVEMLIEETKLLEGLSPKGGVGVLPDIWPYIEDEEYKHKIMDQLVLACEELNEVTESEREYFLEDMYLIEDDLLELVDTKENWYLIREELENFEPDDVPENRLQSFLAQAEQNAKAIEQEKLAKERNKQQQQRMISDN